MEDCIGRDTKDKSEDTLVEVEFVNCIALKLLEEFEGKKKTICLYSNYTN